MVAPLAPMQLSNATDRPGVETSPRGWHTILLPPVPKKPRLLLPQPCLPAPSTPEDRKTSLALAFFFPFWVADGGHNTNTTWLTADSIRPGRRASRSLGKGGVRSRDPSILTQQMMQQQQVWL